MTDKTFLTSLSVDALLNLFRWLSDCPQAKGSHNGVRFEHLHRLYLGDGALSDSFRQVFPVISNLTRFHMVTGDKMDDHLQILPDDKISAVLEAGGSLITGISLNLKNTTFYEARAIVSIIQDHCGNVQKLHVGSYPPSSSAVVELLRNLSRCRYSLSLHSKLRKEGTHAIAMFPGRLRKLELLCPDHDMDTLFAAVGPHLEYLNILGMVSAPNELHQVARYCRKLETFKISRAIGEARSALVHLVVSAFMNLKNFALGYSCACGMFTGEFLTAAHFEEIANRCPNLNCSVAC